MTATATLNRSFSPAESSAIAYIDLRNLPMVEISYQSNPDKVYTYNCTEDFGDLLTETISGTVDGGLGSMVNRAIRAGDLTLV
jgi:hypothetical protein